MFSGAPPRGRRVALGGKSKPEEDREQILARSRLERERRARERARTSAATLVQQAWRRGAAAAGAAAAARQEWSASYGRCAQDQACRDTFQQQVLQDGRCVGLLLFFYDATQPADRAALAAVCAALGRSAAAGACTLLADAASAAAGTAASGNGSCGPRRGAAGPSTQQLALFRVNKLAALCLSTLAARPEAAPLLASPLGALAASTHPAAALVDFLLRLVNPDSWRPSLAAAAAAAADQQQAAVAGATAVLRHLHSRGLMLQLRQLLLALPAGLGKTCADALATQLTVRALAAQLFAARGPASGAEPWPAGAASSGVTQLLLVPQLWAKAGSLLPVAGRLCSLALGELGQLASGKQLVEALLQSSSSMVSAPAGPGARAKVTAAAAAAAAAPTTAAAAVSALLDNVLEAAAAGVLLKSLSPPSPGDQALAAQLVAALALLLEAARQLSVLQRRRWRQAQRDAQAAARQQQGAAAGAPGSSAGAAALQQQPRKPGGFVAGAGFYQTSSAAQAAAAAAAIAEAAVAAEAMDLDAAEGDSGSSEDHEPTSDAMNVEQQQQQQQPQAGAMAAAPAAAAPSSSAAPAVAAGTGAAPASAASSAAAARAGKAAAADAAVLQQPVVASAWSGEQQCRGEQMTAAASCLALLAGSSTGLQLLRALVCILLPATTPAESAQLQQQLQQAQQQPAGAAAFLPGSAAQQQLCSLLWGLSRAPQYRQRVWLGLSVGACLVPRLWFSAVRPVHMTTPGGFLYFTGSSASSASSASSGGGDGAGAGAWMLPLLVLAQAYSTALSFTHAEDFYGTTGGAAAAAGAGPLVPLAQLYDPAAPAAGLLLLVKAAVWQVLWLGTVCAASVPQPPLSPAAAAQQAQLKSAVGEACGLLLCQLHDRNCARQFCPPDAFLADQLPAKRLQQEVMAAAARGTALGGDDSDDDATDPDTSWQQQQQWQQQRQQGLGSGGAAAAAAAAGDGTLAAAAGGAGASAAAAAADDDEELPDAGGAPAAPAAVAEPRRSSTGGGGGAPGGRVWLLLQHAPCLIPFQDRVWLFQGLLAAEKEAAAEAEAAAAMARFDDELQMLMAMQHENRFVTIRRDQLLADGYSQLARLTPSAIKSKLRISYVNEIGVAEAGIDGGGLFKDFMEELLRQGFSPQSGLFAENAQHQLYPNPGALGALPDAEGQLQFLGRMLGKSLYEGMLLELPLAGFFLKKMRGGLCDLSDLPSLDDEVYTHLAALRHYQGDVSELCLTFTATVAEPLPPGAAAGGAGTGAAGASPSSPVSTPRVRQREVELKPGGRDIAVTNANVTEFIHRLADFRLNRHMDRAAAAFLRGFFELIRPRQVRMFNEAELQALISGSEEGVDVDDLAAHCNYASGYYESHPVIVTLWSVLRGLNPGQQRCFLKFVTSCSRAPLLGFAHLEPQLCVQMSGGVLEPGATRRLPTAATCMNLLKLPPYRSAEEMRAKLLYAISAGAGFELS